MAAHELELVVGMDNIVLMALRQEPERRYASAEELSADLDRFLQNLPLRARRESLGYRGRKFLKRNRVPVSPSRLRRRSCSARSPASGGWRDWTRPIDRRAAAGKSFRR